MPGYDSHFCSLSTHNQHSPLLSWLLPQQWRLSDISFALNRQRNLASSLFPDKQNSCNLIKRHERSVLERSVGFLRHRRPEALLSQGWAWKKFQELAALWILNIVCSLISCATLIASHDIKTMSLLPVAFSSAAWANTRVAVEYRIGLSWVREWCSAGQINKSLSSETACSNSVPEKLAKMS